MTTTHTPGTESATAVAARVVAEVLDQPPAVVQAAISLFDLPGFDSLAIVAILDRIEERLAIEVPPEDVVPESFDTVASIADLIARAVPITQPKVR